MKRNIHIITALLLLCTPLAAQRSLTLDECRASALEANNSLKLAAEKHAENEALEKIALWQMLPRISANGTYLWMDRTVNLLSDDQKNTINNLGTNSMHAIGEGLKSEFSTIPGIGDLLGQSIENLIENGSIANTINGMGQQIVEALETDTRNVIAGAVTVSQPLFMGGKLLALHRTAALLSSLSGIEYDKKREETLIAVDEAYWQVVSVKHKKELAQQYADLLQTLNDNVEQMVEAEVATKGDLTQVRVKLNEAQMSLTKATNGLALAKMLLAQRCGMPLNEDFDVATTLDEKAVITVPRVDTVDMEQVWQDRKEMHMLRISDSIAMQNQRIARSMLMPNIALTGGYLFSNPNLFNGFENSLSGSLMAGVVINFPILHPGAFYSIKAAKHKRQEVAYQMEEAREMIELQVNKLSYELELAYKKLAQSQSNLDNAEENLKLADESFKDGMASSSDLMAAQTAWVQAKGEVLDAEIEIEMSRLYLKQALGK